MDTKYLQKISNHGDTIDMNKIPVFLRALVNNFLKPLNQSSSDEYLILAALSMCSYLLCFQRVKIVRSAIDKTFPNIFVIAFLPSGGYKDKPIKNIERHLLSFLEDSAYNLQASYHQAHNRKLEEQAKEIYGVNKNGNLKAGGMTYVRNNSPRNLVTFFSRSTPAGLISQREAYADAGKGCPHLMISELANMLKAKNGDDAQMISLIGEIYDHGDNKPVILKGEKATVAVKDVPQTAWCHSSFEGVLEDRDTHKILMDSLHRQMARRALFFFPTKDIIAKNEDESVDYDEIEKEQKKELWAIRNSDELSKFLEDVYRYFYVNSKTNCGDAEIAMDEECDRLYLLYRQWCEKRARNLPSTLGIEMAGRHWKMMKLAGVIAGFTNKEKGCIVENMETAIYLTEYYGDHYKRLATIKREMLAVQIVDYLQEHGWSGKVKLKQQQFVPHHMFSKAFREERQLIEEECEMRGLMLVVRPYGRNSEEYNVIKAPSSYQEVLRYIKSYQNVGRTSVEKLTKKFGQDIIDILNGDPTVKLGPDSHYFIKQSR